MKFDNSFDIRLGNFSGPLELLLDLVKSKNIDILDINLVELASQYVNIIDNLKKKNIQIASEYLVIAATLVHLKSKILLLTDKKEELDPEIEQDKLEFLALLSDYQQIKNIANMLKEQQEHRNDYFEKNTSNYSDFRRTSNPSQLDGHSSQPILVKILKLMFDRTRAKNRIKINTKQVQVTADQQTLWIKNILNQKENFSFSELFSLPSMKHFVITMISMLEMAKKQDLHLKQQGQFSEISIYRGGFDEN
ncbi:segregation/condensation protein A [Mesomycoplasma flocculare]|uniref:Segregation and condensation protein A n=2 Tax=Mesomycoplasma flocculare TaxID=2128 RepID=A0A0A8E941_MESFC|nr:segregation/condensation protein A [Mesomycoplasma flocculare]MXR39663.1 segregation/condensation protein A [Mycoplasma sp. MF12]AJC50092.1 segregation and condensation protein A [Mesomycoplasma flocculare ATCC 27399]ENX50805.1 segregation and condensation protein A [Mesomycoplasma flocculare ATCC 27716]MXR06090.1 segregation/condensation protein A [Mesomycoplasma flocculare]MXR12236.1 segregation/condensation protein A [Mesomycoplasma flocculare]